MSWPSVSLITYCKGRLHHLRRSLPFYLAQDYPGDWEILVVDYGCPDGTIEFLRQQAADHPRLKCVKVLDHVDCFNLSRARNIGATFASHDVLALIDVDHLPVANFLSLGVGKMIENGLSRANPGDKEGVFGDCFIRRSTYQWLRGYDESFVGWGWEDIDFYNRALIAHEPTVLIPRNSVGLIHHENEERIQHYDVKDTAKSSMDNYLRSQVADRKVNPTGFGNSGSYELLNLAAADGWRILRERYPWSLQRPLMPINLHGWLGQGNARLLADWITRNSPDCIVEVGSWLGLSARFFLNEAQTARVIAIDHWDESRVPAGLWPNGAARFRLLPQFMANCWEHRDRLAICQNDSVCGLKEIAGLGIQPDLIYIDADHGREAVEADVSTAATLFPKATMAGDDWNWTDQSGFTVRPAVEVFARATGRLLTIDDECWLCQPM